MKARAVRVKVSARVSAAFDDRLCELIDISVTGALLVVDAAPTVGTSHTFELGQEGESLDLPARVVRVKETREPGRWQVGVAFEGLTPATRRAISSTVSRLMAGPPPRLPGHR